MSFTVTESADRISATDPAGVEICGAFQPPGLPHWQLFVNQSTGLRIPPQRRNLFGDSARQASRAWVNILANHYTKGGDSTA